MVRELKYNLEYLIRIKSSQSEIFSEDSFYASYDNVKVASSKWKYFSCNPKKGDRARGSLVRECGPWSTANTKSVDNFRKMFCCKAHYRFLSFQVSSGFQEKNYSFKVRLSIS